MRAQGWTLREIAKDLSIALATASEWVRDVDGPADVATAAQSRWPLVIWQSGVLRECSRCNQLLPMELFNRCGDGRQSWCRRCFLGYHDANKAAASGRRRQRHLRACEFVRQYLEHTPCRDCGEASLVVLEFDHVHAKRDWVSRLTARGATLERIQEEIDRCEVVCVNCHRRRSARRGGSRRLGPDFVPSGNRPLRDRNYAFIFEALRSGCVDCGESDLVVLDFDHRDHKNANVSTLARRECSLAKLQREIDLCDIRCANCHRRKTAASSGRFAARISGRG
jgi:hypothetical protein